MHRDKTNTIGIIVIMANSLNRSETNEKRINLGALQRLDPYIEDILTSASQVALYKFMRGEWQKTEIEGTLFVYRRRTPPDFGFLVLNRKSVKNNLIQPITPELEVTLQRPFLLYKPREGTIFGVWFCEPAECERVNKELTSLIEKAKKQGQGQKPAKGGGGGDLAALLSKASNKSDEVVEPRMDDDKGEVEDDDKSNKLMRLLTKKPQTAPRSASPKDVSPNVNGGDNDNSNNGNSSSNNVAAFFAKAAAEQPAAPQQQPQPQQQQQPPPPQQQQPSAFTSPRHPIPMMPPPMMLPPPPFMHPGQFAAMQQHMHAMTMLHQQQGIPPPHMQQQPQQQQPLHSPQQQIENNSLPKMPQSATNLDDLENEMKTKANIIKAEDDEGLTLLSPAAFSENDKQVKVKNGSDLRMKPMNKAEFQEALINLIKTDDEFVEKIHAEFLKNKFKH